MYDLTHNSKLTTEDEVMNIIFDACRANESRENKKIGSCSVNFYQHGEDHRAVVYDRCGVECGSAVVDKFDC